MFSTESSTETTITTTTSPTVAPVNNKHRIDIVRVLYHKTLDVQFDQLERRLSHCDQVFVLIDSKQSLVSSTIQYVCQKVYHQWINKSQPLVAMLQINIVLLEPDISNANPDCPIEKYSYLIGVAKPINQTELICVVLTRDSLLQPNNRCFEMISTEDSFGCHQRPYHLISSTKSLSDHRYFLVETNGWIFVADSSSSLTSSNEYLAIDNKLDLMFELPNNSTRQSSQTNQTGTNSSPSDRLNAQFSDPGNGLVVKYGAIIPNIKTKLDQNDNRISQHRVTFIGERASSSECLNLCSLQKKLNHIDFYEHQQINQDQEEELYPVQTLDIMPPPHYQYSVEGFPLDFNSAEQINPMHIGQTPLVDTSATYNHHNHDLNQFYDTRQESLITDPSPHHPFHHHYAINDITHPQTPSLQLPPYQFESKLPMNVADENLTNNFHFTRTLEPPPMSDPFYPEGSFLLYHHLPTPPLQYFQTQPHYFNLQQHQYDGSNITAVPDLNLQYPTMVYCDSGSIEAAAGILNYPNIYSNGS